MIGVFALGALSLAAVEVYGVVFYSVAHRASEFEIRIALGEPVEPRAAGLAASYALSRWIPGFLFQVRATDAAIFATVPFFLAAVTLAACYIPATRAGRVDPATALRFEGGRPAASAGHGAAHKTIASSGPRPSLRPAAPAGNAILAFAVHEASGGVSLDRWMCLGFIRVTILRRAGIAHPCVPRASHGRRALVVIIED